MDKIKSNKNIDFGFCTAILLIWPLERLISKFMRWGHEMIWSWDETVPERICERVPETNGPWDDRMVPEMAVPELVFFSFCHTFFFQDGNVFKSFTIFLYRTDFVWAAPEQFFFLKARDPCCDPLCNGACSLKPTTHWKNCHMSKFKLQNLDTFSTPPFKIYFIVQTWLS